MEPTNTHILAAKSGSAPVLYEYLSAPKYEAADAITMKKQM
jgi:hypothetical protein